MANGSFPTLAQDASIPPNCTVLVVGGGPGGSYAAAALAREGVDVVLLEADVFPRYHIGESLLPALRYLLRFIDVDSTFDNHGFQKKIGAAFKLNAKNREGYTDFTSAYGADQYVWNVLRSESDDILFKHAGKNGAKVFDGVRVNSIAFENEGEPTSRPVRATYTRKSDSATGEISFQYIVDASGRAGVMSTKYLKNRTYNKSLKNIAWWCYWKGTSPYSPGTPRENAPFFEALRDESGWAWAIPLRGVTSVGLVMNQDISVEKKKSQAPSPSAQEFYLEQLKLAPNLWKLISTGEMTDCPDGGARVKSASDYSYSASFYSAPGLRILGDAAAFIDPFYSSGVHLALTGGMSAAASICAALRGDCSEEDAANWHSVRVTRSYTWFLMVVMGAYKQMRAQNEPVLSDISEDNFDRAFDFLKPVIQGTLDVKKEVSQQQICKTLEFCQSLFSARWQPEDRASVMRKIDEAQKEDLARGADGQGPTAMERLQLTLTDEEKSAFKYIETRKHMRLDDTLTINSFVSDVVDGRRLRLERGKLGLELITEALPLAA